MANPKGFQQRTFDLARKIIVTGIADGTARKHVIDISEGLGDNMLYTPTFG